MTICRSFLVVFSLWTAAMTAVPASATKLVPQSELQIQLSFAPLVKQMAPSVVNVYAARQVRQRRSPFAGDPFFERFFGRGLGGQQRPRTARSLGSGVVIGTDGIIITNNHVIENADEVKIAFADGREFEATIVLVDKTSDLAVLKVDAGEEFPAIALGDSEDLQVGDLVLAIGNPFGVGQTVTSGIVSALARSQMGVNDFGFFIQTDASINPGNSGGALVSMEGELIGINTAIFSRSGGSNGIGFAVPSNMVRVVLDSVRAGSTTLLRPWVGADFQSVTPDIAESLGLDRPRGALVSGVTRNSPAERAGLQLGDIILALDDKPVPQVQALGYRLATAGIGRTVSLSILTKGERRKLDIALEPAPEKPERDVRLIDGRSPFAGLEVANLSPRVAMEVGMGSDKRGVVVLRVQENSTASRMGFKPGDIVLQINGELVESTKALDALSNTQYRGWEFVFERGGRRFSRFVR